MNSSPIKKIRGLKISSNNSRHSQKYQNQSINKFQPTPHLHLQLNSSHKISHSLNKSGIYQNQTPKVIHQNQDKQIHNGIELKFNKVSTDNSIHSNRLSLHQNTNCFDSMIKIDRQLRKIQKEYPSGEWRPSDQKNKHQLMFINPNTIKPSSHENITERSNSKIKRLQDQIVYWKERENNIINQFQIKIKQKNVEFQNFKQKTLKEKQQTAINIKQITKELEEIHKERKIIQSLSQQNQALRNQLRKQSTFQNKYQQPKAHKMIQSSAIKKLNHQNQQLIQEIANLKQYISKFEEHHQSQITTQYQKQNQALKTKIKLQKDQFMKRLQVLEKENYFSKQQIIRSLKQDYNQKLTQCHQLISLKQKAIESNHIQIQRLKSQNNNLSISSKRELEELSNKSRNLMKQLNEVKLNSSVKIRQLQGEIKQKDQQVKKYKDIMDIQNKQVQKLLGEKKQLIIEYNKRINELSIKILGQQKIRIENQEKIKEMEKQIGYFSETMKNIKESQKSPETIKVQTQNSFLKRKISDIKKQLQASREEANKVILSHQKSVQQIKNNSFYRRQNYNIQQVNYAIKTYQIQNNSLAERIKAESNNERQLKKRIEHQQLSIQDLKEKMLISNRKQKSLQNSRRFQCQLSQQQLQITINQNQLKLKQMTQNLNRKNRQNMEKDKFITQFLINRGQKSKDAQDIVDEMNKYFQRILQNQ